MKNTIAASIALCLLLAFSGRANEQHPSADMIAAMHALTGLLTDGYADMYAESAKFVVFRDMPWRGASDGVVVLYYIGGWRQGNTNRQVLAVFARNQALDVNSPVPSPYRVIAFTVAGEKGGRSIKTVSVEGSSIALTGIEHGPGDPMCCPSVPVALRYTVQNHNLVLEAHGG